DDATLPGRVVASRPFAQGDPRHSVERAGGAKLGEHAVETVGRLAHVLEKEDGPVEPGEVGRSQQGDEEAEAAPDQRALGLTRHDGSADERRRGAIRFEEAEESLQGIGRLLAQSRHHRAVNGPNPPDVQGGVQRRHVRKADERLAVLGDELPVEDAEEARGAVAAPGGEDGPHLRLGEGALQQRPALLVAAREVAVRLARKQAKDAVATREEDGLALSQTIFGEGSARGDDGDEVAGTEGTRFGHGARVGKVGVLDLLCPCGPSRQWPGGLYLPPAARARSRSFDSSMRRSRAEARMAASRSSSQVTMASSKRERLSSPRTDMHSLPPAPPANRLVFGLC